MIIADAQVAVINEPIVVALITVAATGLLTLAVAAMRMVVQLTRLQSTVAQIRETQLEMKADPDVMRWSNYGRATQALGGTVPGQVIQP